MLRVLLWKLGSEWAHLLRALSPRPGNKVFYFAFGANLSPDVLAQRRFKVFDAFDYQLENAILRFTQPGFYRNHGYASPDSVDGEIVYGRIYQILARDAVRMDYFEGVPFLRAHDKIYQQTKQFEFFFYRATRVIAGLKPTREYLDYLLDAYRQMPGIPQEHIDALAKTDVLEDMLPLDQTGIFVRDISRWPCWLHTLLIGYERWCKRLVKYIWHRSLLQQLIKT
ncbi:MAG: gamma-glutamylcyclotransferase family protein [Arenicellales bacterium]